MALIPRRERSTWLEPFEHGLFEWPRGPFETVRRLWEEDSIKVDEFIRDHELVVRAELPGVDPERDIDINVVAGELHIRAERRQEQQTDERNVRRSELRYGSFTRVIALPADASEDKVQASYKDGILEVRTPIEEKAGKRASKVPIARG